MNKDGEGSRRRKEKGTDGEKKREEGEAKTTKYNVNIYFRLRDDGIYISRNYYLRAGATEGTYYQPVHEVCQSINTRTTSIK